MTPRHPRPTLFPYTTLFRSVLQAQEAPQMFSTLEKTILLKSVSLFKEISAEDLSYVATISLNRLTDLSRMVFSRSEEHTSELQSLTNLVCRLLLEKKK